MNLSQSPEVALCTNVKTTGVGLKGADKVIFLSSTESMMSIIPCPFSCKSSPLLLTILPPTHTLTFEMAVVPTSQSLPNLASHSLSTYVVSGRQAQVGLATLGMQSLPFTTKMFNKGHCISGCVWHACICKCASTSEHVCILRYARCGWMPHTSRDTEPRSC